MDRADQLKADLLTEELSSAFRTLERSLRQLAHQHAQALAAAEAVIKRYDALEAEHDHLAARLDALTATPERRRADGPPTEDAGQNDHPHDHPRRSIVDRVHEPTRKA